ncbi:uncharacterized protein LOC124828652 [Vigna umbellata]|uniref:uncharacterized protein LOC124828652 n=1 Tax=Vigna umbellata TaxID=87088 RepID=UPI001F5EC669|nr:uncharacterized protein LOC124828652 [Vigna umbellata]
MRPSNAGRFQTKGGGWAQVVSRVYAITGAEAASSAIGEVRISTVCIRCPIEVEGCRFRVNLICLPLQGLEVILGMDWLAANHILIDCGEKRLVFLSEEEELSLTVGKLRIDIMEGASCFLVLSHVDVALEELGYDRSVSREKSGDRSVVSEFLNVFPEEVPGLPPHREVEFSIDLVSGVGPVSRALYIMTPAELAELKEKIEELLEKQFIRPSAITLGSSSAASEEER